VRAGDCYLERPGEGWCVVYGLHAKSSHMYPHPGSFVVMKLNRWRPFGHSQPRQGEKAADIGKAFFPHLGHFIQSHLLHSNRLVFPAYQYGFPHLPHFGAFTIPCSVIFFTCGGSAFSVDALVPRPSN